MPNIIVDQRAHIIFARVAGFLDVEKLVGLARRADSAAAAFGTQVPRHGRLYDLTDAKVAPLGAIDALCDMMADPARMHLRANRVAYFGGSPLVQMQLRRLCGSANAAVFADRRAAYAWASGAQAIVA